VGRVERSWALCAVLCCRGWRRARRPARRQSAGRFACCYGSRSARGSSAVSSSCARGSARGASAVSGLASARRRAGGTFALCLSIERCFHPAGPPPPEAVGMPLGVVVGVLVLVTFVHVGLVGRPAVVAEARLRRHVLPWAGSSRDSRHRVQARGLARSRSGSPPHSVRTRSSGQPSVSTPQPLLRALLALRLPARRCVPSAGFLARQTACWEGALTCARTVRSARCRRRTRHPVGCTRAVTDGMRSAQRRHKLPPCHASLGCVPVPEASQGLCRSPPRRALRSKGPRQLPSFPLSLQRPAPARQARV
jgi:hypothetical protein